VRAHVRSDGELAATSRQDVILGILGSSTRELFTVVVKASVDPEFPFSPR
jgi:hypothetical protein